LFPSVRNEPESNLQKFREVIRRISSPEFSVAPFKGPAQINKIYIGEMIFWRNIAPAKLRVLIQEKYTSH